MKLKHELILIALIVFILAVIPNKAHTRPIHKQEFEHTLLSQSSKDKLRLVNQDLAAVIIRASANTTINFQVNEGLRTEALAAYYRTTGASHTFHSRHLQGYAVDLWIYHGNKVTWNGNEYKELNEVIQEAAKELGINVEWGGTKWAPRFIDLPHWQLKKSEYPDK